MCHESCSSQDFDRLPVLAQRFVRDDSTGVVRTAIHIGGHEPGAVPTSWMFGAVVGLHRCIMTGSRSIPSLEPNI
jgi:hypothetical protein